MRSDNKTAVRPSRARASKVRPLRAPNLAGASVLVLDDNAALTDSIVARLEFNGLTAVGYVSPRDFQRAAKAGLLRDIKLMIFDMRLGVDSAGRMITAVDIMPAARTYAPHARILIFTQKDISLDDCVQCVKLGAMGLIPKSDDADELLLAANVYTRAGDPDQATEEIIKELWDRACHATGAEKGAILEMLVANLLSTISGFSLIATNTILSTGETDLLFENSNTDGFWKEIDSFHLVIECKHRTTPPEKSDFHVLMAKITGKAHCRAGIMASWMPVSSGFLDLQRANSTGSLLYVIDKSHIEAMISKTPAERSTYLKNTLSVQI